jgi:hypothetical protein
MNEISTFTIAIGKPVYICMAIALARSYLRHNRETGIPFAIVTDRPVNDRPGEIKAIGRIEVASSGTARSSDPSLHLDRFTTNEQHLFIDAACLAASTPGSALRSLTNPHPLSTPFKRAQL